MLVCDIDIFWCASVTYHIVVCHESVCLSVCVCVMVDFLLLSFKLIVG
jgi:hypothetical protein